MASKHMLPKGELRDAVKPEYRATRGVEEPTPPPVPVIDFDDLEEDTDATNATSIRTFLADRAAANLRPRTERRCAAHDTHHTTPHQNQKKNPRGGKPTKTEPPPPPPPLPAVP